MYCTYIVLEQCIVAYLQKENQILVSAFEFDVHNNSLSSVQMVDGVVGMQVVGLDELLCYI